MKRLDFIKSVITAFTCFIPSTAKTNKKTVKRNYINENDKLVVESNFKNGYVNVVFFNLYLIKLFFKKLQWNH